MYRPKLTITNAILNSIAVIEAHRVMVMQSRILPERQIELRYRATVEKTHGSTSIEGNPLTLKQVDAALAGHPLGRREYAVLEVTNYKKALDCIDRRKIRQDPISVEDLLKLHVIAMKKLLADEKTGTFRKGDIYIVDQDEHTKYQGPTADRIAERVDDLLVWLASDARQTHPCLAAAILHYQLVTIHPFSDGNGRTTRLAVMLYLGIRDYDCNGALVLDSWYAQDKPEYYAALHACQGVQYREDADITSWVDYFVSGFLSSAKVLSAEMVILSSLVPALEARRMKADETDLLVYAKQFGALSLADACDLLKDTPRRTVQRHLKKLVDDGFLTVSGNGKATRYLWREKCI
jgi:Fic family protein